MIEFDAASVLGEAREIQDLVMVDACVIDRVTGEQFDPALKRTVKTYARIYAGVCRFPNPTSDVRVLLTGEKATPLAPTVRLPHDAAEVLPDDRVQRVASVTDPTPVGQPLWVTSVPPRTYLSAVLLLCRTHQ